MESLIPILSYCVFFSCYLVFFKVCSFILQAMLLDVSQKTSLLLVCKMLLCFLITVLSILLQNHLILVSCELFKVDIFVICSMYCFLSLIMCQWTSFDMTYIGWYSPLKPSFTYLKCRKKDAISSYIHPYINKKLLQIRDGVPLEDIICKIDLNIFKRCLVWSF